MLLVIYSPKILSPNSEKYLESYNSDPPVVIRFLTYFHLLGSRIQVIEKKGMRKEVYLYESTHQNHISPYSIRTED